MVQALMGYKKEFKQTTKKLSNTMFALILSFMQDLDQNRRLLNSLNTTCQEMAYNANMLNVLNDVHETSPMKRAIMDLNSIFS